MPKALFIFALFLAMQSAIAQSNPHYIIHVINAANFKEPAVNLKDADNAATFKADLSRHKHHEVNVYHVTGPMGLSYKVNYYQNEYDSIKVHGFYIPSADNFDNADYIWNKDTLSIQLFTADKKDKIYKGFGWGGKSTLLTPE